MLIMVSFTIPCNIGSNRTCDRSLCPNNITLKSSGNKNKPVKCFRASDCYNTISVCKFAEDTNVVVILKLNAKSHFSVKNTF